jgi:hypothetical protein
LLSQTQLVPLRIGVKRTGQMPFIILNAFGVLKYKVGLYTLNPVDPTL